MPGKIGPFADGGDMDDPHNPASPFMPREQVEDIAAAELGMTDEELALLAAERGCGGISRERALELLTGALIGRMRHVRALLQGTRDYDTQELLRSAIGQAVSELDDILPE
jgi:hypothetical protein